MKHFFTYLFVLIIAVSSCTEKDPALPDNTVQFTASEVGFSSDSTSTTINLTLTRNVDVATTVTIQMQAAGVTYGTHFTTTPAAVSSVISVTVPANSNTASFEVSKVADIILAGTETIDFTITTATSPVIVGTTATLKLSFAQIISSGSTMKLNGGEGGSSAINSVFVDFSGNAQTSVARNSWDLGFYSGSDFRVVINGTTGATATALSKTDLTAVTADDTTSLTSVLILGQGQGTFDVIDDVEGDITKTVIQAVSATDSENPVYILNPGKAGVTQKPWYKIRILRNGTTGYTLQYAKITETTFKTLTITKDATYNFGYVSLTSGASVSVEPATASWDIEWTLATYKASETVPYTYSDFVFVNYLGGATAAEVLTSTVSYDDYAESNISTTTFSSARNTIGSNWRVTSGGTVGVKTDRFYVIKDAAGNVYKLKFLNFITNDGGERGYPNIQYALVKKGS
ncbi:MAG: HmuY family protein [Siphonobacter sp.]